MNGNKFGRLLKAAGPVSRETFDRLLTFETAFLRWNERINLVSRSTVAELWDRHIIDSAQLLPLAQDARHWLDIGSGGGFPGAVVAILLSERAPSRIDLVESNRKKAAFLSAALGSVSTEVHIHARRVDEVNVRTPQIVTARAVAPLPLLFTLSEPWLTHGATALFHKGRDYRAEIKEARDGWHFDLVEHPSATDRDAVILEVTNLRRIRDQRSDMSL